MSPVFGEGDFVGDQWWISARSICGKCQSGLEVCRHWWSLWSWKCDKRIGCAMVIQLAWCVPLGVSSEGLEAAGSCLCQACGERGYLAEPMNIDPPLDRKTLLAQVDVNKWTCEPKWNSFQVVNWFTSGWGDKQPSLLDSFYLRPMQSGKYFIYPL